VEVRHTRLAAVEGTAQTEVHHTRPAAVEGTVQMEAHHTRPAAVEDTVHVEVHHTHPAAAEDTVHLGDILVAGSYWNKEVLVEGLDHVALLVVLVHTLAAAEEVAPIDFVVVEHRSLLVAMDIPFLVVRHNLAVVVGSREEGSLLVVDILPEVDLGCTGRVEDRSLVEENLRMCQHCKHRHGTMLSSRLGGGPPCCPG
jgi:hypothetical protein